jgi:DNA-binding NarL/FixJ family response regulator
MAFRLLIAEPHLALQEAVREVVAAGRPLLPLDLEVADAATLAEVRARVAAWRPHAVLLDWDIAADATPQFVREMGRHAPDLRILVMLPASEPRYRAAIWDAGACAGIPRDRMDGEWLATVVCLMRRAMEREGRLWHRAVARCPVLRELPQDLEVAAR